MRRIGFGEVRVTAAFVALLGGSFLAVHLGSWEAARAITPPPPQITSIMRCADVLAKDLGLAKDVWSGVYDGRRFADGVIEGVPVQDRPAARRLAKRYARALGSAGRTAGRAHQRLVRAVDRWEGTWHPGFYSPGKFAGLTRAIWQTERAGDAASATIEFCVARGASADAFGAAHDTVSDDAVAAVKACDALLADARARCAALLDALSGDAHRAVVERRLAAADEVHDDALAAKDGRGRAKLMARTYRMLLSCVRRGSSFVAKEHRALRRLIVRHPDGSITNGTAEPIVVYDIRAVLIVKVMGKKQTSHAAASEYAPASMPQQVPADAAFDGFAYLVFDRDSIASVGTPGFAQLTYETSIGEVLAEYRFR